MPSDTTATTSRSPIRIRRSDRAAVCGRTGSGKTFWAAHTVPKLFANGLIVDVKAEGDYDHVGGRDAVFTHLSELPNRRTGWHVYQPSMGGMFDHRELDDLEVYDRMWQMLYEQGNRTVIVDETYAIVPPGGRTILPNHKAAITRGRSKNLGIWHLTQRPVEVPNFIFSEAEHFLIFDMNLKSDYDKVKGFAGEEILEPLGEYEAHYYGVRGKQRTRVRA